VCAASSSRSCVRNAATPLSSMASKVTPSIPGAPLFFLASKVGFVKGFQLADVDVQAPEAPGRLGLRLGVDLPSQVLPIDGRLYHPAPASPVVGRMSNSRAPSLHGHYAASAVSGRRRRARLPSRWPPSAAQTERAVFPHSAFTKARYRRRRIEGISAIKRTRPTSP